MNDRDLRFLLSGASSHRVENAYDSGWWQPFPPEPGSPATLADALVRERDLGEG